MAIHNTLDNINAPVSYNLLDAPGETMFNNCDVSIESGYCNDERSESIIKQNEVSERIIYNCFDTREATVSDADTQEEQKEHIKSVVEHTCNSGSVAIPHTDDVVERLKYLGKVYSKAQGSCINWRTDVNLGPPNGRDQEVPKEDRYIWDYYNSLQYTLYETGHPETVDRTATPRADHNPGQVAVTIMASPAECVGILLEGGRQLPDAFHLILSTSWLSKEASETPGLYTLWIYKAITFHHDGSSFIDEFTNPRRVTYFMDFFTSAITGNQRNDGEELEVDIDCPISSPIPLAGMIDDKLWTRCIMATVGMAFPETLALVLKPTRLVVSPDDKIRIVPLEDRSKTNLLLEEVATFLARPSIESAKKVVVKPSGAAYYGSMGVSYHCVRDMTSVIDAVMVLLEALEGGCAILIERYVETFEPNVANNHYGNRQWNVDENLAFRVKTVVCRDFDDKPVTSKVLCARSGLITEPDALRQQNAELRMLLHQYVNSKVNAELEVPLTCILQLEMNPPR